MMNTINETAVTMPSVTHAMKAKNLFLKMGYSCVVKRLAASSQRGCTHYITVNADAQTVISILRRYNIKYGEILPKAVGI